MEPALQIHPVAQDIPMATEAQIRALADDIKANGQTAPITVTEDGVLLDGRARLKACETAGIEPRSTTYRGTAPVSVILDSNPRHQRLSQNRKALIAARARLAFKDHYNA
ncbi:ParB N-terminal domain-containing protein [Kitasatospora aureofaciens]|uniref:ParB N-terminal domain-containing protein n=1 Tax=Kitasatospora aureofaciens TaxID=1894 RepID=UPI0033DFAFD6